MHMTKNTLDLNVNVAQSFQFFVFAQVRFQSCSPPFALTLRNRRCFNRRHWNRYPCSSARRNSCSCCPPRCHESAEDDIICAINGHWRENDGFYALFLLMAQWEKQTRVHGKLNGDSYTKQWILTVKSAHISSKPQKSFRIIGQIWSWWVRNPAF